MADLADALEESLDDNAGSSEELEEELEEEELEEELEEDELEEEPEPTPVAEAPAEPAPPPPVAAFNPFSPPPGAKPPGASDFGDAASFFKDEDDEDEDEDEDDDDDDDDDSSSGKRGRKKKIENQEYDDDLQSFIANFDMNSGQMRLELHRDSPKILLDGRNCGGFLEELVDSNVNIAWVKAKYGGGKYRVRLKGPSRDGKRQNVYIKQTTLNVAGDAIMPVSAVEKERKEDKLRESQNNLFSALMDKNAEAEQRARENEKELREQAETQQNNMLAMVVQMMNNKPDPNETLGPILATMTSTNEKRERELAEQQRLSEERRREDQKAAEERRREERKEAEDRRREEAAERKREEDKAAREHSAMLERMRVDAAAQQAQQLQQMQMQQQAQQAQMQMQMQSQQQMTQMMMQMFQTNGTKSEKQQMQMMEMQRQQQDNMMQMMLATNKKDSMGDTLATLAAMRDFVNPPEVDDRSTVEKVFDKVAEAAPTVVGGLAALNQQQQAAQQQVVAGPRPLAPPQPQTVAVVEDIDAVVQPSGELPPAEVQSGEPVAEATGENPPPLEEDMSNPLKTFPEDPYKNLDIQNGIAMLVQMIDLGIQQELEVDDLFAKAIEPMPTMQKMILKGLPTDGLKEQISANTPETWEIRTAAGDVMIEALHVKLKG